MTQANSTETEARGWFTGGYFLLFGGWAAGFMGTIMFADSEKSSVPSETISTAYLVSGVGLVLFVVGFQVLARATFDTKTQAGSVVIFVLTPIPAVCAIIVSLIGRYFRSAEGTVLRGLLVAGGAALTGVGVKALLDGVHLAGHRDAWQTYAWPVALQFGIGALVLGFVPPTQIETARVPEQAQGV